MKEPAHRIRDKKHIRLEGFAQTQRFQPPSRDFSKMRKPTRPTDVPGHGSRLQTELRAAVEQSRQQALEVEVGAAKAPGGTYVTVSGRDGFALEIEKLESAGLLVVSRPADQGVDSVADTAAADPPAAQHLLTVFIADGKIDGVLKRLHEYIASPDKPKNEALINRLGGFKQATLRSLWTDAPERYPGPGESAWWEVWLRAGAGQAQETFKISAAMVHIRLGQRTLTFADRVVVLAQGTREQFERLMGMCGDLAELRRAKDHPRVFTEMGNKDQGEWAKELAERIDPAGRDAPAVCILDTGVNRGHPLLASSLAVDDTHSVKPAWGTADHDGHGTEMAGIALFGAELPAHLKGKHRVAPAYCLESVKILPPQGVNPPELYGAVTRDAVNIAEAHAAERTLRTFSMAVTVEENDLPGDPTSWSAAVDALAAGRVIDPQGPGVRYDLDAKDARRRLFLVSAGNVEATALAHVRESQESPVEDPAQAWNALTVGAYTEMTSADIRDPKLAGSTVVAQPGDLSPYSTTSVHAAFQGWPIKPEILMEGGNKYVLPGANHGLAHDDLELLTTNAKMQQAHYTMTNGTSAAVSQAARMAAQIQAAHPDYWPETVRALMVHSARWTPRMEAQLVPKPSRTQTETFARTFGYGVPDLNRALSSARDALTLICEDVVAPYLDTAYGDMNLYNLPWPVKELRQLGSETVKLRATLSYFIDPYPVRKEHERRSRYPSTHLRFDLKHALETPANFLKRVNEKANANKDRAAAPREQGDWFLGPIARHAGSLHHDIWTGPAAHLADKGVLAVYPVAGWMKDAPRHRQGRDLLRYSLVISIETTKVDADLWSEVDNQVRLSTAVSIPLNA